MVSLEKVDIQFDDSHIKPVEDTWGNCLAACFTGWFPGLKAVEDAAKSWGVNAKVIPHTNGWVIFKFDSDVDRDMVLEGGPYALGKVTMFLKKLNASFSFDQKEFLKVPVWIKIEGIPPSLWHERGLSMIASALGTPICTDEITANGERYRYARVLVEIDATVTPLHYIKCVLPCGKKFQLGVTYESYPNFCCFCESYGHNSWSCSRDKDGKVTPIMRCVPRKSSGPSKDIKLTKVVAAPQQPVNWKHPSPGWVKLNTDGSVFKRRKSAAAGGVVRDEEGRWMVGFAMKLGESSVTVAEMVGLREGLKLAWERKFPRIEVECDSESVVKLIEGGDRSEHPLYHVIEDCRSLIRNPWVCTIKHIKRSGNSLADALARMGQEMKERQMCVWESQPEELNYKNQAAQFYSPI